MSLNILITTVGGMTSPDIIKAVREKENCRIIGTDSFHLAVGKFFVDKFYHTPSSNDQKEYFSAIQKIVQDESVDIIVPCGNDDNIFFAKNKQDILCPVMVGEPEKLVRAFGKKDLYAFLEKESPKNAPKYFEANNYEEFLDVIKKLGYPEKKVVIKPELGIGGRGVYILSEQHNFSDMMSNRPSGEVPLQAISHILKEQKSFQLLVMEYLDDTFYSAYSLAYQGKNLITLTHIRERGNASQTVRGTVGYNEEIHNLANRIAEHYEISYNFNMELATASDGRIVLFDLNPRIGASSGLDSNLGVNFPVLSIDLALHGDIEKISIPDFKNIKPKRFTRYFDEVWSEL